MRPITVTVGPLTAATGNNIALSQTPGGAGAITLNGSLVTAGVAIIGNAQQIKLTTADSTHTAVISGTSWAGDPISETVAFNGTNVTSVLSYKTVTSIVVNAALTAAITVGTSGLGYSNFARLDEWANAQTSIQCVASGTVTYTVQLSNDDPNSTTNPVAVTAMTWSSSPDSLAVGATGSIFTVLAQSPLWVRINLTAGTGSVTATVVQAGVVPY
jgi:hypothetical protein